MSDKSLLYDLLYHILVFRHNSSLLDMPSNNNLLSQGDGDIRKSAASTFPSP